MLNLTKFLSKSNSINCYKAAVGSTGLQGQLLMKTPKRFTSDSTVSHTKPSQDTSKFNKEFNQQEYDHNAEQHSDLTNKSGKEHVEHNTKGFKDLQEKGSRTAQEQNRPEDYM
ncbi:hypothetical protein WICMUC_005957 [Wickerhamomyces mucosus]|uniref:Uncharacterized protein n=1 Tax=Wickerhamomyces mucosus TaxID=1378264 RepID=A0A9P8P1T3_9ASCO|nr:hypothetical protein WICMUC_005957 [Wickerhamomyces mucosus]